MTNLSLKAKIVSIVPKGIFQNPNTDICGNENKMLSCPDLPKSAGELFIMMVEQSVSQRIVLRASEGGKIYRLG